MNQKIIGSALRIIGIIALWLGISFIKAFNPTWSILGLVITALAIGMVYYGQKMCDIEFSKKSIAILVALALLFFII